MPTTALRTRPATALAAAALLLMLAACGGSAGDDDATSTADRAAATPAMLDDDGGLMPSIPQAEPADPGARTRAGRYATAAQADQLERALAGGVISTRVDGAADGAGAVDLAVLIVHGLQAAHDLDVHAPVLVRGADLRLAAVAANRLHDNGYTRVVLVTP